MYILRVMLGYIPINTISWAIKQILTILNNKKIQCILKNGITLEIKNRKNTGKSPNMWELSNSIVNNSRAKEEISTKTRQ